MHWQLRHYPSPYPEQEPLLLLHGWGMHAGLWQACAEQLAAYRPVICVDLPGHGGASPWPADTAQAWPLLDAWVDALAAEFAGQRLLLGGWSLGGILAMRWALRYPEQIVRLLLVATTPCFMARADWQAAVPPQVLAGFAAALQQNAGQTLKRFLALQVRGSEQERELRHSLRRLMATQAVPALASLQQGLQLLRDIDLRADLSRLGQPVLLLAGERDGLTPLAAAKAMARQLPDARLVVMPKAAHAPFLSHQSEFIQQVSGFLHG